MISLTRINHVPLVLNSDLIEHIEVTPDTVISLTTGQKFMVLESAEEIIQRIQEFRRAACQCFGGPPAGTRKASGPPGGGLASDDD